MKKINRSKINKKKIVALIIVILATHAHQAISLPVPKSGYDYEHDHGFGYENIFNPVNKTKEQESSRTRAPHTQVTRKNKTRAQKINKTKTHNFSHKLPDIFSLLKKRKNSSHVNLENHDCDNLDCSNHDCNICGKENVSTKNMGYLSCCKNSKNICDKCVKTICHQQYETLNNYSISPPKNISNKLWFEVNNKNFFWNKNRLWNFTRKNRKKVWTRIELPRCPHCRTHIISNLVNPAMQLPLTKHVLLELLKEHH